MITTAINAHEQCEFATIDIPGVFLHASINQETFMLLKGRLAELMVQVQVDPQLYCKFVIYNKNNQALLYVKLSKATYGLIKSALLFYKKFVKDLKNYESPFTINPYNPCIANATINSKQMTITWHVNDLKVSHVNPFQITKFAAYLATIYGNGLVVHRGKVHDYLGMDLNFATDGIAQVSMITYTSKILSDFPELITTSCATPAADHLFTVRDESKAKFLPEAQAQAFHHTVAQLLFLCKQTCRDIQTAVSFLITHVNCPDEDDWGKLKRIFQYLRGTRHMKLNLSADNLTCLRWWVDSSHAIHDDCQGHTGAMMSLGKGAAISFSNKHRINSKSSTESELIGANQALSSILHTRYFIEA
jgi:hypothetical protein